MKQACCSESAATYSSGLDACAVSIHTGFVSFSAAAVTKNMGPACCRCRGSCAKCYQEVGNPPSRRPFGLAFGGFLCPTVGHAQKP